MKIANPRMKCNICKKGITQHVSIIQCSLCKLPVHSKCLPLYMEEDIQYARTPSNHWSCTKCLSEIFPFYNLTNDDDILSCIKDIAPQNLEALENMLFDPFELNEDGGILDEIDPDSNFYNIHANSLINTSKYLQPELVCSATNKTKLPMNLSVFSLNIRSMRQNHTALDSLLSSIDFPFSFIGLTETWLKPHNANLFGISGYSHEFITRDDRPGGGLSLFIKDNLDYRVRHDLTYISHDSEMLWVELAGNELDMKSNIAVGLIYRRPGSNAADFNDLLADKLSILSRENKIIVHTGDYNLDLLKHDSHPLTNSFLDTNLSRSLIPIINKPTRVTNSTATIIDNVFTNILDPDETLSFILPIDISDHFPICYFVSKVSNNMHAQPAPSMKRDLSKKNIHIFNNKISSHDWTPILSSTNSQEAYTLFHSTFTSYYNSSFPLKKSQSLYKSRLPWLSEGIKAAIKKKNSLFSKKLCHPNAKNTQIYKTYRNKLNHVIKIAQRTYYQDQLTLHKSNLRKTWQFINMAINRSKSTKQTIKTLNINGTKTSDPAAIVTHFNKYFTNIGSVLDSKIPHTSTDPTSFIKETNLESIYLRLCTDDEVSKVITSLKHCATGWDSIPASLIQENSQTITPTLTHIINLSLTQGVFPSEMKIAILIPIFKSGLKDEAGNYRPISLLTSFSKIFERIMYTRISNFFKTQKLFYELQFGFRENHSTEMSIITLMDRIISALEKGHYTVGIFLDFSKAFDTVNHEILLSKLNKYGIRGVANDWIRSYLSNRQQYALINNYKSDPLPISCGVPQGSILGPLLFLIYINDLPNFSNQLTSILFADDSNLFTDSKNLLELQNKINEEMPKLVDWLSANRLSLNVGKTHLMIFSPNKQPHPNINIYINGIALDIVTKTKFLGLMLDNKLNWKSHALYLSSKISKSIGILSIARKFLNQKTLIQLYYSFIYPYLIYANLAWGKASDVALWPIYKIQKLAIRLIANLPRRSSSKPFCKSHSILRLPDIYTQSTALFMFKFKNSLLPDIFKSFFITNSNIHTYPTRSAHKLRIPLVKSQIANSFITKTGVDIWNTMPISLTTKMKIGSFKIRLKNSLIATY